MVLPVALWACWRRPAVRGWLLLGTGTYIAVRGWSFLYFIPLALKFETAPEMTGSLMQQARNWVGLSPIRCVIALANVVLLWRAAIALEAPERAYKGIALEGMLARWYAKTTGSRRESYRECAALVAPQVPRGGSVLEIAPGPGYMAIELARLADCRVVGLDISRSFVAMARQNARAAGVAVTFVQGNAADMPFAPESFDVIVCRAAFKNFAEPVQAINEMRRVLKPGGKALIYDLRPDASPEAINAEVSKMGLAPRDALMTRLIFKYMLLQTAYSQDQFRQMVSQTSFQVCDIHPDGVGLAVCLSK
jgi:ubiquinone/menaquinone biosynthesis C-methylase UbiE